MECLVLLKSTRKLNLLFCFVSLCVGRSRRIVEFVFLGRDGVGQSRFECDDRV